MMKKYFALLLLIACWTPLWAQTISITDVYRTYYCTETEYSVGFTATGTFSNDNVFEAQLSDSIGNFSVSSPIIGRFSSSSGGAVIMNFVIPPTVVSGTRYGIRVISTDPVMQSSGNNMPLTIFSPVPPTVSVGGNHCITSNPLLASGTGNVSIINWYQGDSIKVASSSPASYDLSIVAGGNGQGNGANQFHLPAAIFVDGNGNLYVDDAGNFRIQKFLVNSTKNTAGITVAGGNGEGSANDQLDDPQEIFVDASGNLYVSDAGNNRVLKFPPGSSSLTQGTIVAGGNGSGNEPDQLNDPGGLYVDGDANIYVTDVNNNRIQKFPPNSTSATPGVTVAGGNGAGSNADQFNFPLTVYVDGNGNLYVDDELNFRIQKFPAGSTSGSAAITAAGGNGQGNAPDQLGDIRAIYVDGNGNIYAADESNHRVVRFPPGSTSATNGVAILFTSDGDAYAIDDSGSIYIVDPDSNRVQKFQPIVADSSYNTTRAGGYSATYTDWEGCVSLYSKEVTRHNTQPLPEIIKVGDQLQLTNADIYLGGSWCQDSVLLGYTGPLNVTQNGIYFIIAVDSNECHDTSQTIDVTDIEGITNVPQQSSLKLYPNPNTGSFILETNNSIGYDFIIYDLIGNMIMHQTITNDKQVVTLKEVSAGTYTLRLKGNPGQGIRFTVY